MRLSSLAKKLRPDSRDLIAERVKVLEARGKKIIHLEIGDPSFATPRHIVESAVSALRANETHYGSAMGLADFRAAVAYRVKQDLNFLPEKNQIIAGPSPALIFFLLQCIVNRGDEIIVPDPSFARYLSIFRILGIKPVGVPLREANEFRLLAKDVAKRISDRTRLIIINSPHNPTGAVMTEKDIRGISELARRNKILILSDEVYSKLIYEGKHFSPGTFDRCQKETVILSSVSKIYAMTGWRLGYMIGPHELIEKISLLVRNTIFSIPDFIQRAGIEALTGSQRAVTAMAHEYRRRRNLLVHGLNSLPGVSCLLPHGGLYAFPNISGTSMMSDEFVRFMVDKAGVTLAPGTAYGSAGQGYIRASFAVSPKEISHAIKRMRRALVKR